MQAKDIRRTFLEFFRSKGHQIVPSAPMVIKNDPTLMFTNAGMNQFKDLFLGNKPIEHPRIADTQKCLRVSGKHNDLEEVGLDTYHHTMFEMLGNWSFGDYFKVEAIEWSWELLTEVYKIPKDRLYVTYFEGDPAENLEPDSEAKALWAKYVHEDHIIPGNKKDNFWEMGDTGPCGPCSEIHVDLRSDEERKRIPGRQMVNQSDPQVIEIWNNVFIQFERKWKSADAQQHFLEKDKEYRTANADDPGKYGKLRNELLSECSLLAPLPSKHVDTGMGFERLVRVIQGKQSNYDTDVFTPIIFRIEELSGHRYGKNEKSDIAMRVIADHIRAVGIAIADGQLPGNTGAGYVIRRILRRAIRYGYSFLDMKKPFIYLLTEQLDDTLGDTFPEIHKQREFIAKTIQEEETSFLRTMEKGLHRLQEITAGLSDRIVPGDKVFELYDTYGFPADLTRLIANEQGLSVDEAAFEQKLNEQKERSKAAGKISAGDWVELSQETNVTFLGYDQLEAESRVLKYRKVSQKGKDIFQVVLNQTPFYAESGGQVGDKGWLESANEKIAVKDTVKENDLILHILDHIPANPEAVFTARVDGRLRQLTANNHSATHLLHAALRRVLGTHVEQRGSLVVPDYLRFDFSHHSKMTDDELGQVEHLVNEKIRENIALNEQRSVPFKEAQSLGAMALFGEKYGDKVRVITFDPQYSVELCGGTHVQATGQIGYFKIISESSVAAGVRRVEAITADKYEEYINGELDMLQQLKALLKNQTDPIRGAENLLKENEELRRAVESFKAQQAGKVKADLLSRIQETNGMRFLAEKVELDADTIKNIAFDMKKEMQDLFLVLGAQHDGKALLTVMLGDELVKKGMNAKTIINDLAKAIQGGGGGQDFYATAGGKNPAGLPDALAKAREMVK